MGGGGRVFDKSLLDGNNRSWLGGRSLTGPHIRGLLFSSITIAVAAGIAFGISFPWLLHKHPALAYPLLVVFTVALAISLAAGWLTGTTDPGIIPRSAAAPPDIQRNPGRPRERRLVLRGRQIVTKYCETCRIWRPPHASHCSTCNNCVDRFDHHCPYCSGCIGRRNYRSFLTFVVSTAVLSAVAVAAAVAHIVLKTRDFQRARSLSAVDALGKTLSDGPTAANVIVIVIAALALAFTGGLTGFHLYLMWNNMTTAESFKKANRNSISDSDDLRGLRAIWHLISVKRPDSRITAGYDGPPYPDAREVAALIEAQDEDDALALPPPAGVDRLPLTGARVPSAASRLAKLSAGFAAAEEARTEAKV